MDGVTPQNAATGVVTVVLSVCPVCNELYRSEVDHCPVDGSPLKIWEADRVGPKEPDERDSSTFPFARGKGRRRRALATATTVGSSEGRSRRDSSPAPVVDQVLRNRYHLEEMLGVGGYGVVFSAIDRKLEKKVAIKILSPEFAKQRDGILRFRGEAVAAGQIRHEGIVTINDFEVDDDGTPFIVMEYLDGCDLATQIAADGALPPSRALLIAIQAARALSAAHRAGIIHRDLKPSNIYLTRTQDRADFVKIIDFGISKLLHNQISTPDSGALVLGTPFYMAPEQARSDNVDQRVDIYSLGLILYEMVTGIRPFAGRSAVEIITNHHSVEPLPPSKAAPFRGLDAGLDRLVMRCLEKHPDDRYQSMDEFSNTMLDYLDQIDPRALTLSITRWRRAPSLPPEPITERPAWETRAVVAFILLGVLAGAIALWKLRAARKATAPPPASAPALRQPAAAGEIDDLQPPAPREQLSPPSVAPLPASRAAPAAAKPGGRNAGRKKATSRATPDKPKAAGRPRPGVVKEW